MLYIVRINSNIISCTDCGVTITKYSYNTSEVGSFLDTAYELCDTLKTNKTDLAESRLVAEDSGKEVCI
jgi:ribosomal protein L37AE/L43A